MEFNTIGTWASIISLIIGMLAFASVRKGIRPLWSWIVGKLSGDQEAYRVSVGIVYRCDEGKGHYILMVKRNDGSEPLTWQFPSGHVKPKEEPAAKVIDVVKDETGVACKVKRKISERTHPNTHVRCYYYICAFMCGDPTNLDVNENSSVEWVPSGSVRGRVTSDIDPNVGDWLDKLRSA